MAYIFEKQDFSNIFLSEASVLFTKMHVRFIKKNHVTVTYVGRPEIGISEI